MFYHLLERVVPAPEKSRPNNKAVAKHFVDFGLETPPISTPACIASGAYFFG